MTVEKRLENALRISENIIDGKICPNNLYDLQLHLSDALEQVKKLTIPDVVKSFTCNVCFKSTKNDKDNEGYTYCDSCLEL